MTGVHAVATWTLVVLVSGLVLAIVGAALRVAALADAVCPPEPPVRVRSHRGRDGVLRVYWLIRAEPDEWYPG
jgi:hypothetical protein